MDLGTVITVGTLTVFCVFLGWALLLNFYGSASKSSSQSRYHIPEAVEPDMSGSAAFRNSRLFPSFSASDKSEFDAFKADQDSDEDAEGGDSHWKRFGHEQLSNPYKLTVTGKRLYVNPEDGEDLSDEYEEPVSEVENADDQIAIVQPDVEEETEAAYEEETDSVLADMQESVPEARLGPARIDTLQGTEDSIEKAKTLSPLVLKFFVDFDRPVSVKTVYEVATKHGLQFEDGIFKHLNQNLSPDMCMIPKNTRIAKFDLSESEQIIKGVGIAFILDSELQPLQTFSNLMKKVMQVSKDLNGNLCDEKGDRMVRDVLLSYVSRVRTQLELAA